jgi:hypothetical protein
VAFERVKRTRKGDYLLRIPSSERELLRTLPAQLRELLTGGDAATDPALRRLFPPATMDDAQINAEFDRLMRDDLSAEKLAAIDTFERTVDAQRLSEDELTSWLAAINDLRLVFGVRLNVTEETTAANYDPEDPLAQLYAVYLYLTFLEDHLISALADSV